MNTIFMYWFRMEGDRQNFGDVLGPYLVEKLTGAKVTYVPIKCSTLKGVAIYIYRILWGSNKIKDLISLLKKDRRKPTLISIGSIIGWYNSPNCNIWGSGIMFKNDAITNANFYAVRGRCTQQRLKELGYQVPDVIGDPALLLPLVYNPIQEKKYKLGIIPHFVHFDQTSKQINNPDVLIINLLDNIEKVVKDLKSCQFTISSSLHGIIVSHAYGIPSLWYNLPGEKLHGDNIKFLDYFSSIEIDNYEPFEIQFSTKIEIDSIIKNIDDHCDILAISDVLKKLQKGLLEVAPFELLMEYKVNVLKF
ncbi:polysaccharide pyruvyl transferase family protein [Flavobacterium sp. N3904]|uniref:polysaccharide pyruvyl transferase family protein n=1 Tax=Flavobacterium sp. N3904 TaxID=2986835 RepID=UPI002225A12A|nr:polysaccharide pyruvyl transferase family protein [Flavobacterium sp. N3904]